MTPAAALPDGSAVPATRAELLRLQADAVHMTAHRLNSLGRLARMGGWLALVGFLGLAVVVGAGEYSPTGSVVVFAVLTALACWRLLRHLVEGERLSSLLRAWQQVDRRADARALPGGGIPAELMTLYDARDDHALAERRDELRARALAGIYDVRLLVPALLVSVPIVVGLVELLVGVLEDDAGPGSARVCLVVAGGILAFAGLRGAWQVTAQAWRRQQLLNVVAAEGELYLARRRALGEQRAELDEALRAPVVARVVVAAVAALLVVILVVRLVAASAPAVWVTLAVLLVAVVWVSVPLLRRRRLHVVPLLAEGDSVLEAPTRRIRLEREGEELCLVPTSAGEPVRIPAEDVVGTAKVRLGYPFAPPARGILTRDDVVLLAGSEVASHPALRELDGAESPAR